MNPEKSSLKSNHIVLNQSIKCLLSLESELFFQSISIDSHFSTIIDEYLSNFKSDFESLNNLNDIQISILTNILLVFTRIVDKKELKKIKDPIYFETEIMQKFIHLDMVIHICRIYSFFKNFGTTVVPVIDRLLLHNQSILQNISRYDELLNCLPTDNTVIESLSELPKDEAQQIIETLLSKTLVFNVLVTYFPLVVPNLIDQANILKISEFLNISFIHLINICLKYSNEKSIKENTNLIYSTLINVIIKWFKSHLNSLKPNKNTLNVWKLKPDRIIMKNVLMQFLKYNHVVKICFRSFEFNEIYKEACDYLNSQEKKYATSSLKNTIGEDSEENGLNTSIKVEDIHQTTVIDSVSSMFPQLERRVVSILLDSYNNDPNKVISLVLDNPDIISKIESQFVQTTIKKPTINAPEKNLPFKLEQDKISVDPRISQLTKNLFDIQVKEEEEKIEKFLNNMKTVPPLEGTLEDILDTYEDELDDSFPVAPNDIAQSNSTKTKINNRGKNISMYGREASRNDNKNDKRKVKVIVSNRRPPDN